MTRDRTSTRDRTTAEDGRGAERPARGLCGGLRLAAAPVFASMAAATALDPSPPLCAPARAVSPLDGMVLMYLLMGLFHLPPWLTLLSAPARRPFPDPDPRKGDRP